VYREGEVRVLEAKYDDTKEFKIDKKGYFLIKTNADKKEIEVAFCSESNKVALKVTGTTPVEIYHTIINKEKLDIRKDHYAYLGRELQRAYDCLERGEEYVQI